MKKVFILLVVVLIFVNTIGWFHPLEKTKATTLVKQWSFYDASSNLTYYCYEYSDASLKVEEYFYGGSRTIYGHAYLDQNGYPKAVVDLTTSQYWDFVISNYRRQTNFDLVMSLASLVVYPFVTAGDYAVYKSLTWALITGIIQSNISRNVADVVKVAFEIGCTNQCAIDLAHTRGIILPTIIIQNE